MPADQLLLDLGAAPRLGRDDFVQAPSNTAGLDAVEGWSRWPDHRMLLTGPEGSGRTHLAAIFADRTGAVRLCGRGLGAPGPAPAPAYAVDDADSVAGSDAREEALFHLINHARAHGSPLLLTARDTPGTWGVRLPDLESRLLATSVTRLDRPDDALLTMALVKLFDDRQLAVEEATITYLVPRIDRSLRMARTVVEAIDRAAVTDQKRVTRSMAADVLAGLG